MKHAPLWLAVGAATLIAATLGYCLGTAATRASATPDAGATAAASAGPGMVPNLTLPDLDGRPQALAQWSGKVLVVNYWATWCPPCRDEMPGFARLQAKYAASGVQFVGISIDQEDKVREFQKETPVNYPLLMGEFGAMQTSMDLGNDRQALPFTAVFDRQGRLDSFRVGRLAESTLEKTLQRLLEQ